MTRHLTALAAATLLAACPSSSAPVQPAGQGSSTGPAPTAPALVVSTDDGAAATAEDAATASNAFAVALYEQLREGDGNRFFSPASISTALAMTTVGAAGNTEAEMRKVLRLPAAGAHQAFGALQEALVADRGDSAELTVANRLWGSQGYTFLDTFLDTTRAHYGAGLERVDFGASEVARGIINGWVSAQTKDKIPELIPGGVIDGSTRLVLTNAIYFLGKWRDAFDADVTFPAPFFRAAKGEVQAQLMHRRGRYGYAEDSDVQVVTLPYKDADMSMVVVLPRDKGGLAEVEDDLADKLGGWIEAARRYTKVDLFLPRFEMRANASLAKHLEALGMADAFDNRADFSGMDGSLELYIQAVIHEAYVKVDEAGTEAAGATAVIVGRKSAAMPRPVPTFRADHPFFFVIKDDRTGAILFIGRVADPS